MAWNGLLGGAILFFAYQLMQDGPKQVLRDKCYNSTDSFPQQEALAACNKLLTDLEGERRADWIFARGSAHYMLNDYEQALADYRTAVRLNPENSSAHFNIGLVYEQLGDRRMASEAYTAAIKADPNNAEAAERRRVIFSGLDIVKP